MNGAVLRRRLADLIAEASDGAVAVTDALTPDRSLHDLGIGSLAFLRLVDAMEAEYGLPVDLAADEPLDTVDELVTHLRRQGLPVTDD